MRLCFLNTHWTFYFFKVFYILRLYKNLLQSTLLLLIHQICYFNPIKYFPIKFNWLEQKRCYTLLMSKILWRSNLEHKLRTFAIVILNTKWKECKSHKSLCTINFTYTKNFTYSKLPPYFYQKITCWKTQRKHVNQTTTI